MPEPGAPRFSGQYYEGGLLFIDGMPVMYLGSVVGGERNTSSLTNNFTATKHEANRTYLSDGTGAKVITNVAAYCMGIIVHTALAGTLTITGFLDDAGVAANVVLPIGFVGGWGLGNAAYAASGLTLQKSSATDNGRIVIDWRPAV
jgi:hypothetical protein